MISVKFFPHHSLLFGLYQFHSLTTPRFSHYTLMIHIFMLNNHFSREELRQSVSLTDFIDIDYSKKLTSSILRNKWREDNFYFFHSNCEFALLLKMISHWVNNWMNKDGQLANLLNAASIIDRIVKRVSTDTRTGEWVREKKSFFYKFPLSISTFFHLLLLFILFFEGYKSLSTLKHIAQLIKSRVNLTSQRSYCTFWRCEWVKEEEKFYT